MPTDESPTKPGETPGAPEGQPQAGLTPQAGQDEFDRERAMATIEKLRGFEREALKLRKQIADQEAQAQKAKEAEMTELEKARADLQRVQTEMKALQLSNLRREAAQAAGLPVELAERLQGDTLDDLQADALALLKIIKPPQQEADTKAQPPASGPPRLVPTNPGPAKQGETQAERRDRIYGYDRTGRVFDPAFAKTLGGGVVFVEPGGGKE